MEIELAAIRRAIIKTMEYAKAHKDEPAFVLASTLNCLEFIWGLTQNMLDEIERNKEEK